MKLKKLKVFLRKFLKSDGTMIPKNATTWKTSKIKTFEGLQSMSAIPTIILSIIYSSPSPCTPGYCLRAAKTLNKERMYELCNFIYSKISTIIKSLTRKYDPKGFPSLIRSISK